MAIEEPQGPRSPLWPHVALFCEKPSPEHLELFLDAIKQGGSESFFSRLMRVSVVSALEQIQEEFGERWTDVDKEFSARVHHQVLGFAGEFAKQGNEVFATLMEKLISEISQSGDKRS